MDDITDFEPTKTEKTEMFNTGAGYFARLDWLLTMTTNSRINKKSIDYFNYLESVYAEVECKLDGEEAKEAIAHMTITKRVLDNSRGVYTVELHKQFLSTETFLRRKIDKYGMLTPKTDVEDPGTALRRGRGW